MTDVYRQAASVLVLRPAADGYEFLLLHKPRKRDAWQLPQGGIESGESLMQAALRELHEEAGLTGCQPLGESAEFYQYDFPASFRRFRPDHIKGQRIGYVFALAPKDAAVQVDNKEVDAFLWTTLPEMTRHIKRKQYVELVRKLYQEAVGLME